MGARTGQADLLVYQAALHQTLELPAGYGGAHRVGVNAAQEMGFLVGLAGGGQFPPGSAGSIAEGSQRGGISVGISIRGGIGARTGAGYGGEAGTLMRAEAGGQQRRSGGKGGAKVGLAEPFGQFQPQRPHQRGWLHGVQDVPGFRLGNSRFRRQTDYQTLHIAAPKTHPYQLAGFHGQVAGNAVGKGFAGGDPVRINGDIGVVHDAPSRKAGGDYLAGTCAATATSFPGKVRAQYGQRNGRRG